MNTRILIVSSREDDYRLIENLLQNFPGGIDIASDGIQALHKLLSNRYTAVIVFPPLELLDADKLIEIVRTNPNTSSIPFMIITEEEKYRRSGDVLISKPVDPSEFITKLNEILPQSRIKKLLDRTRVISFNLDEISITDILQILYQNRKTGVLELEIDDKKGKIYLINGEIQNARLGTLKGEKALFRIFESQIGSAVFLNQAVDLKKEIPYPTPHLILRGIQEKDETEKILQELGNRELRLAGDYKEKMEESSSIVSEVISLLEYTSYLPVILDSIDAPDSEVLKVIKDLMDKGVILPAKGREITVTNGKSILSPEEERKLIEKFTRKTASHTGTYRGMVILVPEHFDQIKKILKFLYFESSVGESTPSFFRLGYFPLSRRVHLNFYAVTDPETFFPFINSFKKFIVETIFMYDEFSQEALYITQERGKYYTMSGVKVNSLFFEEGEYEEGYFFPMNEKEEFASFLRNLIKKEIEGVEND